MKKIYVVHCFGGEYEDRFDYPICAFESEEEANKFANELKEFEKSREKDMDFYDAYLYDVRSLIVAENIEEAYVVARMKWHIL